MLWWKCGYLQITSYEAYVHQPLSSEIDIKWKKLKSFVTRKIWHFALGIFPFSSFIYYLTCGFIAPTSAFNLLTHALSLLTLAFNLPTGAFNLATRAFSLLTREFELTTRRFKLITRRFQLVTRKIELVTRRFYDILASKRYWDFL